MKVQCDVCQRAEATMVCCADEAALCRTCDQEIHAANKLASKHHRVPLLHKTPSQAPTCDICQEKVGYFFCLEDRALLCRQCDVVIHTATPYVANHQRFLVTGVRVALHHLPGNSENPNNDNSLLSSSGDHSTTTTLNHRNNSSDASQTAGAAAASGAEELPPPAEEDVLRWPWEEMLGSGELDVYSFGCSRFEDK